MLFQEICASHESLMKPDHLKLLKLKKNPTLPYDS